VLIDGVSRGSLAQQAGLISNDVIVSVNGQRVDSTAGLWSTLAGLNGDPVEFGVYRNGQLLTVALPTAQGAQAGGFARPGCWGWGADGTPIYVTPAGAFGGRMGGQGLGPGGILVCPDCGTKVAHQRGVACYTVPCPACGTQMIRVQ
jgi:membrane-associated protease RseP (regulator of RpoE activity)